jgi:hypothetical protein
VCHPEGGFHHMHTNGLYVALAGAAIGLALLWLINRKK